MNPAMPTHGRRTDAEPSSAPRASDTTTMPTIKAALSLVPKSLIARSLSDAAKRSMNCVPTALISDGPGPASPHTNSLTPSAAPAATTPASAPWARVGRRAAGRGASAAPRSSASVATAMT